MIKQISPFLFKSEKFTAAIELDSNPMNPREEYDQDCIIICFHNKYKLGDKHGINIGSSWEDTLEQIKTKYQNHNIQPLYLYDHGSLTLSLIPSACNFDSVQVGFIICPEPDALETMKHELNEYNNYIQGDVWCYSIAKDGNVVDSCCGFYGLYRAQEEVRDMLEYWETV